MDLVDAQQARRVLDRLVGYSISPILWKKVQKVCQLVGFSPVALQVELLIRKMKSMLSSLKVDYDSTFKGQSTISS